LCTFALARAGILTFINNNQSHNKLQYVQFFLEKRLITEINIYVKYVNKFIFIYLL